MKPIRVRKKYLAIALVVVFATGGIAVLALGNARRDGILQ
jgi:hypothetical protein